MGGVEIRGLLAFGAVVLAIALLWVRIDSHEIPKAVGFGTTTTTTSIAIASTTSTTTPEQAIETVCDAADALQADIAALEKDEQTGEDVDVGAAIRLTASFWTDVLPDLPSEVRTEAVAVVDYYQGYLEVAEPFDHDPVQIIVEGDKERYEQLLTRPVPGLDTSREFVASTCGVEVPDKPSMSAGRFSDLEDRLLHPDRLKR